MNLLPGKKTAFLTILASLFASGSLLAQSSDSDVTTTASGAGVNIVGLVIEVILAVVIIAAMWKVFVKAGRPGWASIIPIYNAYVLCKMAGKPGWWVILLMIPLVGFIFGIILMIELAKNFGKGAGFGIGLLLLGFIFFPILGFGDAQYQGPPA